MDSSRSDRQGYIALSSRPRALRPVAGNSRSARAYRHRRFCLGRARSRAIAGERGAANNFADVIRDVDAFARHISERYEIPIENMIILAHSLAAVSVAAWVHDYAPPIRAMILATAAFHVQLYVPLAIPLLRMKQRLFGPGQVKSYVKSKLLTRDKKQAAQYDADPLIFRQIAVNVLLDLYDTAHRLVADA